MILDSLHKEQKTVERRIVRYLKDVWSARPPQGGKKTLEVEEVSYPTVPQQPNDKDCGLYVMKCFEQFLELAVVYMESKLLPPRHSPSVR